MVNINNTIIYQAKSSGGVSIPFIILCVIFIVLVLIVIKTWKYQKLFSKILLIVVLSVLVVIIFSVIYNALEARVQVYDRYVESKYSTVEGVIENYKEVKGISNNDIKYDSFDISGVVFQVPGFTTNWGYQLRQVDGGILKNGLKVKICYEHYKFENVIMELELVQEK